MTISEKHHLSMAILDKKKKAEFLRKKDPSEKYLQITVKCSELQLLAKKCSAYFITLILSINDGKVIFTAHRINNL